VCVCAYVCVYVCVCVRACVCACVCVCVCEHQTRLPEAPGHFQIHNGAHIEVQDITKGGVRHEHDCVIPYAPVVSDGFACVHLCVCVCVCV